jgi:hypothetical protein
MKKIAIGIFIMVSVFSFIFCKQQEQTSTPAQTQAQTQTTEEFKAVITTYSGKVTLNGQPVTRGSIIKSGDVLETDPAGSCEIMIKDKNILMLKGGKVVFNVKGSNNTIQLERGWFAGVTKQKFTEQGEFNISTPTALAGVRGTSFCIKVIKPAETYFCVCNGVIRLKGQGQEESAAETVRAAHHQSKKFVKDANGKIKVINNAGLLFHDDNSVNAMAKKIGVTVNWNHVD